MTDWKDYEGKKVFLKLINGRQYSGKIINVDRTNPQLPFITMIDKFGKKVMFSQSEVSVVEEQE